MQRAAGPPVVLIGGFLTSPIAYRRMARRLLNRGASSVRVVPIRTPAWFLATATGLGPLVAGVRGVIEAEHEAAGRPVLVVGHSTGGLLARLALTPRPFRGQPGSDPERVAAIVTLGTPHRAGARPRFSRVTWQAARFLERVAPGAYWAPRVGYLSVGSRYVEGGGWRNGWTRWSAGRFYGAFLGDRAARGWGDSLIPVDACELDGARCLTLEGIAHGQAIAAWYGDDPGLDGWWDAAVETWRDALRAREAASRRARPLNTQAAPIARSGAVP
jgi:pimeloyl-ACP methyl ester carboxylesterase